MLKLAPDELDAGPAGGALFLSFRYARAAT